MTIWLQVVVATPAHSAIAGPLTYRSEELLTPGTLVRVPLGKREVLGVVWGHAEGSGDLLEMQTKSIAGVLEGLAPLGARWRALVSFTAAYYQRSLGGTSIHFIPNLFTTKAINIKNRPKAMNPACAWANPP